VVDEYEGGAGVAATVLEVKQRFFLALKV